MATNPDESGDSDSDSSDTSSHYSSISHDTLPPIRAYGHTYHGSGRLLSPNDASEAHRLAIQHELLKLCLDGNVVDARLPLDALNARDPPFRILDVGAGSGLWACEMGTRFPHASILGIDLTSALLPADVPPNVSFEIADAADASAWSPSRTYDFIHMRNLIGGGIRDWPLLLSRALSRLSPGGILEFTELRPRFYDVSGADSSPEIGAACTEFEREFSAMCERIGIDFDPIEKAKVWLSELGAVEVRERSDFLPVKRWGKDAGTQAKGRLLQELMEKGMENWSLRLFGLGGWSEEATRELLGRMIEEIKHEELRSYVKATFVTAKKPLGKTDTESSV